MAPAGFYCDFGRGAEFWTSSPERQPDGACSNGPFMPPLSPRQPGGACSNGPFMPPLSPRHPGGACSNGPFTPPLSPRYDEFGGIAWMLPHLAATNSMTPMAQAIARDVNVALPAGYEMMEEEEEEVNISRGVSLDWDS